MKKLLYDEILEERETLISIKEVERYPISVILHNIRSLYNVGSIFRTCDSARVEELILCGYTPHPPRKELDKTALGSVDTVPWSYFKNTEDAIKSQKNSGKKVIAVELTDKKRSYTSLEKSEFPISLIFGNELSGIPDEILELCDDAIEIPMHGVKHSLNVSVTAGITIFESLRTFNK